MFLLRAKIQFSAPTQSFTTLVTPVPRNPTVSSGLHRHWAGTKLHIYIYIHAGKTAFVHIKYKSFFKRGECAWWHTPLIPSHRRQRQANHGEFGDKPGLHSAFQASQGHKVKQQQQQ